MSVIIGYRQTPFRNGAYRTYLTPEDMPRREPIAYTTSESINARPPNRNFADFNDRTVSQCFSCLLLTLLS